MKILIFLTQIKNHLDAKNFLKKMRTSIVQSKIFKCLPIELIRISKNIIFYANQNMDYTITYVTHATLNINIPAPFIKKRKKKDTTRYFLTESNNYFPNC